MTERHSLRGRLEPRRHTHTGPTGSTGQLKRTVSPHRENTADAPRNLESRARGQRGPGAGLCGLFSSEFCPVTDGQTKITPRTTLPHSHPSPLLAFDSPPHALPGSPRSPHNLLVSFFSRTKRSQFQILSCPYIPVMLSFFLGRGLCHLARDSLVPQPGIKPTSPVLEGLNHKTTREVPCSASMP